MRRKHLHACHLVEPRALAIGYSIYALVRAEPEEKREKGRKGEEESEQVSFSPLRPFSASRGPGSAFRAPSPHAFALITILVLLAVAFIFVKASKMFPSIWYFIPVIAVLATMINVALQDERLVRVWIVGRSAVFLTIVAFCLRPLWENAHLRRTNLDLVAQIVAKQAGPSDLVLVNPFWLWPGFKYHYHGQAPWNCLPMISTEGKPSEDPHAAIKEMMATPNSLAPTLEAVKQTLASGHRVWMVGGVDLPVQWYKYKDAIAVASVSGRPVYVVQLAKLPPPNGEPPEIPAAPNSPYGWDNNVYTQLLVDEPWRLPAKAWSKHEVDQVPVLEVPLPQRLMAALGASASRNRSDSPSPKARWKKDRWKSSKAAGGRDAAR